MDEASRLVSELQSKLAELDQRVWQYRRDMTSEFEKHAESLLRDVPQDVSKTVSKCLAESMKGYSSLYPDGKVPFESCATGTGTSIGKIENDDGAPPQPRVTSASMAFLQPTAQEEDIPRSPHARDKEFRGVFVPNYLPLLDRTNRNERRLSSDTLISPPPGRISPQPRSMDPVQVDASTDTRSLVSSPEVTRPPTPRRRNTDEVSVASDFSEGGHPRRSALRRSSSTSRQSPRRVRFEVEGEEVLPTASPQSSKSVSSEEILTSLGDAMGEEDYELGAEQIEDIDKPPPKRISSSQALRALSRSPLEDDGTTWTTVSAPPDGSASVATTDTDLLYQYGEEDEEDEDLFMGNGKSHFGSNGSLRSSGGQIREKTENDVGRNTMGELDEASDDDSLNMPPLRRQAPSPKSMLSPIKAPSPAHLDISHNKSPTSSTRPSRTLKDLETLTNQAAPMKNNGSRFAPGAADDEDMFAFDEAEEKRAVSLEDEEYDDFDTDAPVSPISKEPVGSKYSSSPAREIARSTPANSPAIKDIVGSFKGQPYSLGMVNPEVHAQAASLGDVNSFVGSVDGRTGLDEIDAKSYRMVSGVGASSFSGAPRSLTERMLQEDLKAEADQKEKEKGMEMAISGLVIKETQKLKAKEGEKSKAKDNDKPKAKDTENSKGKETENKPKPKDTEKSKPKEKDVEKQGKKKGEKK